MVRTVFFMALLAACGGGSPSPDPGEKDSVGDPENPGNPGDPAVTVEHGTLHTVVGPEITGAAPVQLRLDGAMMPNTEIVPGSELAVELEAGTHTVGLVCPDYCWATTNGTWDSQAESCTEWELDVNVPENDTANLDATLCYDLTDEWSLDGGPLTNVVMHSVNGRCTTQGMPLFNFEVLGDQVRPDNGSGDWINILDNGARIEIEGMTFTRLE